MVVVEEEQASGSRANMGRENKGGAVRQRRRSKDSSSKRQTDTLPQVEENATVSTLLTTLGFFMLLIPLILKVGEVLYDSPEKQGPRYGRRVQDTQLELHLDLEQFYTGDVTTVSFSHQVVCTKCGGSGAEHMEECHTCSGTGRVVQLQRMGPFTQRVQTTCRACGGRGHHVHKQCDQCSGHGAYEETLERDIEVRPGARSGEAVVLNGEGNQMPGADPGNVVIFLLQDPHSRYARHEDDLHTTVVLTLAESLIGFERELEHLDGRDIEVARSDVTPHGYVMVIAGEGMPRKASTWRSGSFGDMLVTFEVQFPSRLSRDQVIGVNEFLPDE